MGSSTLHGQLAAQKGRPLLEKAAAVKPAAAQLPRAFSSAMSRSFLLAFILEVCVFCCVQMPCALRRHSAAAPEASAAFHKSLADAVSDSVVLTAFCGVLLMISTCLLVRVTCMEPGWLPTGDELRAALEDETRLESTAALENVVKLYEDVFRLADRPLDRALTPPNDEVQVAAQLESKPRWCRTCHIWRPTGCSHCSTCGRCCLGFDHHCQVVGTCIGRRNRRVFVLMCCFSACASLALLSSCLPILWPQIVLVWEDARTRDWGQVLADYLPWTPWVAHTKLILFSGMVAVCAAGSTLVYLGLALLGVAVAGIVATAGVQLVGAGDEHGFLAYSVIVGAWFVPLALTQAAGQLQLVSQGLTFKGQLKCMEAGEDPLPPSWSRVRDFFRAAPEHSCILA
eukprot:TRINITY_DN33419_c0_g1_i1.p1 TRINITY_DN33419_c0_g1~~TRINITY_DN33419_c0_g1_i1.p1  ORF type:complete len:399 (-),score=53.74 TRINITY_DN33419_c0_g1_i1:258-1454(-)